VTNRITKPPFLEEKVNSHQENFQMTNDYFY